MKSKFSQVGIHFVIERQEIEKTSNNKVGKLSLLKHPIMVLEIVGQSMDQLHLIIYSSMFTVKQQLNTRDLSNFMKAKNM